MSTDLAGAASRWLTSPYRCLLTGVAGVGYSWADLAVCAIVKPAGGWGSWQAVTCIAGFAVFAAGLAMAVAATIRSERAGR